MVNCMVPISVHRDENVVMDEKTPNYEDGTSKIISLRRKSKLIDLKNKVFELTGFDWRYYDIKISCKWPLHCSSTCVEITDDDTMEVMLSLNDKVTTVEVYVEKLDLDYGTLSQAHRTFYHKLHSNVGLRCWFGRV